MTQVWKIPTAALVVLVVSVGVARDYHVRHVAEKEGYDRADREWRAREATMAETAREHAEVETAQARADSAALQERFDIMADIRQKEKAQHEDDKRNAIARALSGAERMRLPGAADGGALRDAGNGQGAVLGAGAPATPPAYLLPQTAADILDIAADYGQLVRDYNAVVDRYADAERACNATKPIGE